MKPLLCAASVVRNFLNLEVNSWPPKPIDASKPFQWQDRRPLKKQPPEGLKLIENFARPWLWNKTGKPYDGRDMEASRAVFDTATDCKEPLKVGDVLYVRETFFHEPASYDETLGGGPYHEGGTYYRADYDESRKPDMPPWKPSIHMPRELSRIHLEVMRVRVERACDISEEDAKAEGVCNAANAGECEGDHRTMFIVLWENLYGTDARGKWVWVYDLKRIK